MRLIVFLRWNALYQHPLPAKRPETVLKQINSSQNQLRFSDDYDVFYQLEEDGKKAVSWPSIW